MRGDRGKKIERLKHNIRESGLVTMDSLPLFLDPGVQIVGVDAGIDSRKIITNGKTMRRYSSRVYLR